MHIEINYRDGNSSQMLDQRIDETLRHTIGHLADRLTRLEVHLGDENAHKGGTNDKRCLIEARPKGLDPIAIETHGEDFYETVKEAAGKLKRALDNRFDKLGHS
ncbi:MAG: HPF/RaiA family ribosome-associated protein [Phycisphaera sp.]|nr:MAG: HPF/RaiA family ribosome-associated protein [Phycisphaera sp.]